MRSKRFKRYTKRIKRHGAKSRYIRRQKRRRLIRSRPELKYAEFSNTFTIVPYATVSPVDLPALDIFPSIVAGSGTSSRIGRSIRPVKWSIRIAAQRNPNPTIAQETGGNPLGLIRVLMLQPRTRASIPRVFDQPNAAHGGNLTNQNFIIQPVNTADFRIYCDRKMKVFWNLRIANTVTETTQYNYNPLGTNFMAKNIYLKRNLYYTSSASDKPQDDYPLMYLYSTQYAEITVWSRLYYVDN